MKIYIFLSSLIFLVACGSGQVEPKLIQTPYSYELKVEYLKDIKPILDHRCVTCHSCYNSPCQSKYSSFEGVDRGGSKALVYDATRLLSADPTRLFIDAQSTKEWRDKEFFSLTDELNSSIYKDSSIMMQLLQDKKKNPDIIGDYEPEYDTLICPKDQKEVDKYLRKKPNHGMPYGFPALKKEEFKTLRSWLHQGAKGTTIKEQREITTPTKSAKLEIDRWERFLNNPNLKYTMSARYLYEHYFLAHINFGNSTDEFYEMIRSYTPAPKAIEVIPTLRPFDDPKVDKFYYRFRRIHSTLVHKTHMVVEFDKGELDRIRELFITPKWSIKPHKVGYDSSISANPFITFAQIPTLSRYRFLLEHSHYIIKTFIRGPVCRGQMALNVIHDHFWVMFQDPKFDLSIQNPKFLKSQYQNLSIPIESSMLSIFSTFSDSYRDKYRAYFRYKQLLYDTTYPNGIGLEGIWRGRKSSDAPLLTIYRHFNSASVHRGVVGELPRTAWVIDYPQLERIYYSLVAGYDVYGNISHQTNIRRYMDFLRMEGEINFLSYLPKGERLSTFKSWYIGDSEIERQIDCVMKRGTKIKYKSSYHKSEFIEQVVNSHILKSTNILFDNLNYFSQGQKPPKMPKVFKTKKDFIDAGRSITVEGTGFIRHINGWGTNLLHLKIMLPHNKTHVATLVVNRWHDNVNSLFGEKSRLDSSKDTIDIVDGYVGSYPNLFAVVDYSELPDFFDLIANFDGSQKDYSRIERYFISRSNPKFWETFDWFMRDFRAKDPLNYGLYDLNRYYKSGW